MGKTGWVTRPTKEQLAAARDVLLEDVIAPGLRVLFCGINPGLYSAATGWHFARPGNRFWPALYGGGFTPRLFKPSEQGRLPGLGLGITNVVGRTTARADELSGEELREGGSLLAAKVAEFRPEWVAIVGITAYRVAFGVPKAEIGPQDDPIGGTAVWVLPNPSGLNAHWTPGTLAEEFSRLHKATYNSG
ncbi:MAG: double-stranded uracil-DNA glycosylase [Actinomycetota bacterium]|nr:double-stranded uracil-DNA glycosylase [Actinomycetota bacterium]